jgi:hypothetical protein
MQLAQEFALNRRVQRLSGRKAIEADGKFQKVERSEFDSASSVVGTRILAPTAEVPRRTRQKRRLRPKRVTAGRFLLPITRRSIALNRSATSFSVSAYSISHSPPGTAYPILAAAAVVAIRRIIERRGGNQPQH